MNGVVPASAVLLLAAASTTLAAQPPGPVSDSDVDELESIVVTATRLPIRAFAVPAMAYSLSSADVQGLYQSRTLPEALGEVPGVLVQKTSNGQGSPFIRGFTGFRNVLLIDGIRLNNSVFRDGPNQYWNTVDTLRGKPHRGGEGPGLGALWQRRHRRSGQRALGCSRVGQAGILAARVLPLLERGVL